MADTPIAKKLGIKPGQKLLILNAPENYQEMLGDLPEGAEVYTGGEGPFDFVQLFVKSKAEVDSQAQRVIQAVKPGGLLWLSYPKKSSKIKTDIHRDTGWEAMVEAGWEGVTLISLDDTWSAFRLRPHSEIKARNKV